MLREADIELLADVRTIPRSRSNLQFNRDVLQTALAAQQIDYEYIAALGGLRSKQREVAQSVNAFWHNKSFHNYADYALSEDFAAGLVELRRLGAETRSAIKDPVRCATRSLSIASCSRLVSLMSRSRTYES